MELSKCERWGGGGGTEAEVEFKAVGALWLRERAQPSGEAELTSWLLLLCDLGQGTFPHFPWLGPSVLTL